MLCVCSAYHDDEVYDESVHPEQELVVRRYLAHLAQSQGPENIARHVIG